MAELAPTRRIDRVPKWNVPLASALAFDMPNKRLLVAGARSLRALALDSGDEVLRFESEGHPTRGRSYLIRVPAKRALALVSEELIAWDTTTGKIVSRAPIPGATWLDSISDDGTRVAIANAVTAEPIVPMNRIFATSPRISIVEIATGRVVMNLGTVAAATQRATILLAGGGVVLLERSGRIVEYDSRGTEVRRHEPIPREPDPGAPGGNGAPAPMQFGADFTENFSEIMPLVADIVLCRSLGENVLRNRITGERSRQVRSAMMESIIPTGDGTALLRRPSSPPAREIRQDVQTGATEAISGYGVIDWQLAAEEDGVIATADYSGTIRVLRRGEPHSLAIPLDVIPSQPESIAISPDGSTVIVGCADGSLRVMEGDRIRALPGHTGQAGATGFLDDGRMWTSSGDHHRVWSRAGRVEVDEAFLGSTYGNPTTSQSGKLLFGVRDASVTVRSTETGRVLRDRVVGSTSIRDGGGLLEDGTTFFSVSEQGVFRWNLETGEQTAALLPAQLESEPNWQSFQATPDASGARVLLHGYGASTRIWEPDTGSLRTVPGTRDATRARWFGNRLLLLGTHEDDQTLAVIDTRIHVVDASSLARVDVLTGPEEPIRAFTAAGSFVCAIGEDRRIAIWRYGTGG